MRGATRLATISRARAPDFNPRSSCEERLTVNHHNHLLKYNFNPRSSCEERRGQSFIIECRLVFQSTLLMRGATGIRGVSYSTRRGFQSTLLMRGATSLSRQRVGGEMISIHAPHARSDSPRSGGLFAYQKISIHAPHARSDNSPRSMRSIIS